MKGKHTYAVRIQARLLAGNRALETPDAIGYFSHRGHGSEIPADHPVRVLFDCTVAQIHRDLVVRQSSQLDGCGDLKFFS